MKTLAEVEAEHIKAVLDAVPDLDKAAKVLGIHTTTLYRKRVRLKLPLKQPFFVTNHEKNTESKNTEIGPEEFKKARAVLQKPKP